MGGRENGKKEGWEWKEGGWENRKKGGWEGERVGGREKQRDCSSTGSFLK